MKNKRHFLIGGCAVLLVGLYNPVSAAETNTSRLIHSLLSLHEKLTAEKEQVRREIEQLVQETEMLRAQARQARRQAWKKVKDDFKRPPRGYRSWQQYHDEQRRKEMDRGR